jgi:hypothetical protein
VLSELAGLGRGVPGTKGKKRVAARAFEKACRIIVHEFSIAVIVVRIAAVSLTSAAV